MKLSLFTPTHKPTHLLDTWDSVNRQRFNAWEWVIVLNGGASVEDIPQSIREDSRVRVLPGPDTDKIGALKKFSCEQCQGDVFVELDHDDMLVPGALTHVANAAENNPGSFLYSDSAVFESEENKTWGYNTAWGWTHSKLNVYGQPFVVTRAFPVTPRSLCEIYVAPDHLRAWTREAYEKVGGHDVTLGVCDDHDLMCRTYIAGVPFVHVGGCQYLYRWHPQNTVKERQKQIWKQNDANRKKYLQGMIAEWCRRENHDYIEITGHGDIDARRIAGVVHPQWGHIHFKEFLQYVGHKEQVEVFNSAFEGLVPGGYLTVDVPSPNGKYADQDPRTVTRFNDNSFRYYTDKRLARTNHAIKCKFQLVDIYEFFPDDFHKELGMNTIRAELCALKGQRHPGPVHI